MCLLEQFPRLVAHMHSDKKEKKCSKYKHPLLMPHCHFLSVQQRRPLFVQMSIRQCVSSTKTPHLASLAAIVEAVVAVCVAGFKCRLSLFSIAPSTCKDIFDPTMGCCQRSTVNVFIFAPFKTKLFLTCRPLSSLCPQLF